MGFLNFFKESYPFLKLRLKDSYPFCTQALRETGGRTLTYAKPAPAKRKQENAYATQLPQLFCHLLAMFHIQNCILHAACVCDHYMFKLNAIALRNHTNPTRESGARLAFAHLMQEW